MNIFPSPIFPVFADFSIASTTLGASTSEVTTSIFILGIKSTTYSAPLYNSVCPFCLPNPFTSVTVIPWMPISFRASFTSSSLKGFIIASIFFISHLLSRHILTTENTEECALCGFMFYTGQKILRKIYVPERYRHHKAFLFQPLTFQDQQPHFAATRIS